jgi:hypothetical protein
MNLEWGKDMLILLMQSHEKLYNKILEGGTIDA